jgi:3-oxoacyl-[acyl-carrier-protein] synthase-3
LPGELIKAGIAGIGVYVPDKVLTNAQLEKMVDTSDEWISTRSGIRERHITAPEQATSDLAVLAADRALADAGSSPEELDLIIVATNTPDMSFPSTACLVQERIGAKKAGAFDLAAGCAGFIYALSVASQFIAAGSCRQVLVIGAENLSKIVNWEDRNTCVLFGDAAGAVVMSPARQGSGFLNFKLGADGSGGPLLRLPAGGSRLPASQATVENKLHYLQMNGREVFKFAVRVMVEATEEVLSAGGFCKNDLDFFIPHQANVRIIDAAAKRLKLPREKILINVDRYGNTSTASIPLALEEALRDGRIKQGDHVVMAGFGAGLTWAAALLKW